MKAIGKTPLIKLERLTESGWGAIFIACVYLFTTTNCYGQANNQKLELSHLAGDFYVFTTYQSFNGNPFPANGMYLVTKDGVVLFDTPWDTTQFQPLLDCIKIRHKKNIVICIATHSHNDRTGGLEFYKQKGVKTFTTTQTDEICKVRNEKRAQYLIEKDTVFKVGQHSFQIYYGGQGHTPDNIVVWFKKDRVLYGGCLVKSIEAQDLGNLADANVKDWEGTIKNIQRKFINPAFIITGHQDWNSLESLNHTIMLIRQEEEKKK